MKLIQLVVCLFPLYLLAQTEAVKPAAPQQLFKEAAESALRQRVERFYSLQIDGKFRQTEALVCSESQDNYYALPKSRPLGAHFDSVKFSEDLKSATVSELIEDNYSFGGIEKKIKMPVSSRWKLVDEQWCYYVPPVSDTPDSPFGNMDFSGGKNKPSGGIAASPPPVVKPPDLSNVARIVTFSKLVVALPFDADGNDEIEVTNNLPGPIQFRYSCPNVPGLVCKFADTTLSAGGKTKLHVAFKFEGTNLSGGKNIDVWILPFEKLVSISLTKLQAAKRQ